MRAFLSSRTLAPAVAICAWLAGVPARADEGAYVVDVAYTAELWQNARGGLARDAAYLDNLDVVLVVDAERAWGWQGATGLVSILYNNRATFSEIIVGDVQTVSNIDTSGSLRLYEAWIDAPVGGVALKLGAIDLNSEFDFSDTGALFIGSSHGIGPDFSQVGENGPSIFPAIGLGARAGIGLSDDWSLKLGLFEGVPGAPDRPRRTRFVFEQGEGVLAVAEVERKIGETGRATVGLWQHSGQFERIDPPTAGSPDRRRGHPGAYAIIEGRVAEFGDDHGLNAFARAGIADPGVHRIKNYLGAGLVFDGPILADGGRSEQLGLALAVASNGSAFLRTSPQSDKREVAIELTYRIDLTPWLALQPDVQYIIDPGAEPGLGDALAVGLRIVLSWNSDRGKRQADR